MILFDMHRMIFHFHSVSLQTVSSDQVNRLPGEHVLGTLNFSREINFYHLMIDTNYI